MSDGNSRAFNGSGATRDVALDISKAFDKVWHIGFLHNLNLMKFQVKYLALFCLLSVKDGFWLFYIGSLYFNTGVFQASILGFTLFLLYINELPNDVICNIAVYADDTSLYSTCDQASDLWQQLKLASELESDIRHCGLGQKVAF